MRAAEAQKDDSGIVDLAMAAQSDPQAAVRAQTTAARERRSLRRRARARSGPAAVPSSALAADPRAASCPRSPRLDPAVAAPARPRARLRQRRSSRPVARRPVAAASLVAHALPAKKKGSGSGHRARLRRPRRAQRVAAGGFLFMKHRASRRRRARRGAPPIAPVVARPPPPRAEAPPSRREPPSRPSPSASIRTRCRGRRPHEVAVAPKSRRSARSRRRREAAAAPRSRRKRSPKLTAEGSRRRPRAAPAAISASAMKKEVGASGKAEQTPAAGNNGPQFAGQRPAEALAGRGHGRDRRGPPERARVPRPRRSGLARVDHVRLGGHRPERQRQRRRRGQAGRGLHQGGAHEGEGRAVRRGDLHGEHHRSSLSRSSVEGFPSRARRAHPSRWAFRVCAAVRAGTRIALR